MVEGGQRPDKGKGLGWGVVRLDALRHPPEALASFLYMLTFFVILALTVTAAILIARTFLPIWTFQPLESDALRNLLIAISALIAAPFAIWRIVLSHWNTRATQEQARVALENHYTTLFTKAVEQLGAMREVKVTENVGGEGAKKYETVTRTEPNIEVRLGAIYSFERIARDSSRDHWPIMETLCAYVRGNGRSILPMPTADTDDIAENVAWRPKYSSEALAEWRARTSEPTPDVQAALFVIARSVKLGASLHEGAGLRRLDLRRSSLQRIDLGGLDLAGADFTEAHIEDALLNKTDLQNASLGKAHFEGASMELAVLDKALLDHAHFEGAMAYGVSMKHVLARWARFEGAWLVGAHFTGAWLHEAYFERAMLWRANLDNAVLDDAHLEAAFLDSSDLTNATMRGVRLEYASLRGVTCKGATLDGAHLFGAWLENLDLTQCKSIDNIKLEGSFGFRVLLPPEIERPASWLADSSTELEIDLSRDRWEKERQGYIRGVLKSRLEKDL